MTNIQWTDETWNPTVGCSKISEGCRNCYAIGQAYRNSAMGAKLENPGRLAYYDRLTEKKGSRTEWTGVVNFVPEALTIPIKWKKPRRIFVNSMSDLFHESVPFEWIDQIFAVMALTPQHTYQVLTKRPDRMAEYCNNFTIEQLRRGADAAGLPLPPLFGKGFCALPNVWLGVTVENQKAANERIPLLLKTPAALRFLSCEPLLEMVDIHHWLANNPEQAEYNLANYGRSNPIGWVIIGGESGPGARELYIDWVDELIEQCCNASVPYFVKQLGSNPIDSHSIAFGYKYFPMKLKDKKGADMDEWPAGLRVREFPEVAA